MHRVPVPLVVGRELEVPLQLPGVGVERHNRIGVEIVSGANVGVPVGARVADPPIGEIELGVVGAGEPNGASPRLPGIVFPGLMAGLAGAGDGVELPDLLARLRVVSRQETANAEFAAGRPDDDLVLDNQRRKSERVAFAVVEDSRVP